ncbi:hypothetical protein H4582DRAFT_2051945 [Lactarius indigo]|nr:hypothetical protein H4582DRAFT_2051945 [Lactarius indigo]
MVGGTPWSPLLLSGFGVPLKVGPPVVAEVNMGVWCIVGVIGLGGVVGGKGTVVSVLGGTGKGYWGFGNLGFSGAEGFSDLESKERVPYLLLEGMVTVPYFRGWFLGVKGLGSNYIAAR